MRAVQCRAPASLDNLAIVDLPEPPLPVAGEITVRIEASSLNFHDYAVVTGQLPITNGRIPMSDGAGRVIALGAGVTDFQVGDLVASTFFPLWIDGRLSESAAAQVPGDGIDGYACELVTVPANWFTRVPKGYSAFEAATLPCAAVTAWRALQVNGNLAAGESVLVMGSGGVSVFALQLAKAAGATVIATSSSDEKAERLRALGADHVINYREVPSWGEKVLELTSGFGVDHIVEIGGAGTLGQSITACRAGGHIALVGVLAGFAGSVNTAMIMRKQLRIEGLTVGSRAHQLQLIDAIDRLGIRPVIDCDFSLSNIAEAFRHQERGAHFGKIVINVTAV
jgi:NADPH:quinone reductase-like Zn-dependent oxidoreductase